MLLLAYTLFFSKKEEKIMFNHVVALLLGMTTFILGVVALFKSDLLSAVAYDTATTPEYRARDVNKFLDNMDTERENRCQDNRFVSQLRGFRSEWYSFEDEWACNLCESM